MRVPVSSTTFCFLACFVLCHLHPGASAYAQNNSGEVIAARKQGPGIEVKYYDGLLTVSAREADISTLFDEISGVTGVPIETNEPLPGKTTIRFSDEKLEDAINKILDHAGEKHYRTQFKRKKKAEGEGYRIDKVTVFLHRRRPAQKKPELAEFDEGEGIVRYEGKLLTVIARKMSAMQLFRTLERIVSQEKEYELRIETADPVDCDITIDLHRNATDAVMERVTAAIKPGIYQGSFLPMEVRVEDGKQVGTKTWVIRKLSEEEEEERRALIHRHMEDGKQFLKAGKLSEAGYAFFQAKELDPYNLDAEYYTGKVSEAKDDYSNAARRFQGVLAKDPDRSEVYYDLALVQMKRKEIDSALRNLREFVDRSDDAGKVRKAERWIAELESEEGKAYSSSLKSGKKLLRKGDHEKAERIFKDLIQRSPERREAYTLLASLYLRQQKYPDYSSVLEELVEMDPRNVNYLLNLAYGYAYQGRAEDVLGALKTIRTLKPGADTDSMVAEKIKEIEEELTKRNSKE